MSYDFTFRLLNIPSTQRRGAKRRENAARRGRRVEVAATDEIEQVLELGTGHEGLAALISPNPAA